MDFANPCDLAPEGRLDKVTAAQTDSVAGHFLKEWRRFRGLTQADLARAMAVSRSGLNKVERGRREISASVLARAATVLACTPDDIRHRSPTDSSGFAALCLSLSEADKRLAAAILRAMFSMGDATFERSHDFR
jgi:transcriptional regulator with XRE-family HTH domain